MRWPTNQPQQRWRGARGTFILGTLILLFGLSVILWQVYGGELDTTGWTLVVMLPPMLLILTWAARNMRKTSE